MKGEIAWAKLVIKVFLSATEPPVQTIPAFAPPNGIPASAFFHVMVRARRNTSSAVTLGVIRIPPFPGPRAVLSITKNPFIPIFGSRIVSTHSGPYISFLISVSTLLYSEYVLSAASQLFRIHRAPLVKSDLAFFVYENCLRHRESADRFIE